MNCGNWIVCEQSNRWAAALRLLLDDQARADGSRYQLREVRTLTELAASLSERLACLACIEVRRANLSDVLAWLAMAPKDFGDARFVALLDYSLQPDPWAAAESRLNEPGDVMDALREAGAAMVITSPRRLGSLVEMGRGPAGHRRLLSAAKDAEMTLAAKVWTSLPWQAG
jgi:hypothetical protein